MVKSLNRYTSNEFHDWQRLNLPGRFVIQDIDTWAIIVSDSETEYNPLFICELKRSFYEPDKWTPFEADKPNYLAIYKLALKAGLPLIIIYFKKGEEIKDSTQLAVLKVNFVKDRVPWIDYRKNLYTAIEFREKFPKIC